MAESRTTYRSLVPPTVGGKAEATVVGAGSGAGARRAGLLGAGGRRAFVIEAMLLLAFLGMALALILQMFAASSRISREAHDQAMLCQLAGNAAQQALATQVEPGSSEAFFDGAGQPCDQAQAVYRVQVEALAASGDSTDALGQLLDIHVRAQAVQAQDASQVSGISSDGASDEASGKEQASFAIDTQRYVPASEQGGRS